LKILYGVSPIGLGHASRAVAVASKLREKGHEVEFATGEPASSFLTAYGYKVHDIVRAPVPFESDGKILFSALWYARYWFGYRTSRTKMSHVIDATKPDLVVGDEEFSSVSIALEKGLKQAIVTDERELGFAKSFLATRIEGRVMEWYANLQRSVSCLIVPDFGVDERNIHYVTPIVRERTMTREEVLSTHGLPSDARIITCSMSGSGIGRHLTEAAIQSFRRVNPDRTVMVVVGGDAHTAPENGVFHLGFVRDNQNLVAASSLVISLAGKSTIDEAQSYGVPIIAIPLRNHFEQERNATSIGFSYEDITRLDSLIVDYLKRTQRPRNYQGASIAAELLIHLAQSSDSG
jgi:UDP-N-acetylglucosamine--N-acetylmuramyl-(pentapeptide) pyrophosphoryl-undecaprenol N-acetylglucosamine transferase